MVETAIEEDRYTSKKPVERVKLVPRSDTDYVQELGIFEVRV